MAFSSSITYSGLQDPSPVLGTYTADGTAQTVTVGFQPSALLIINQTASANNIMWWSVNSSSKVFLNSVAASSEGPTAVSTGFTLSASGTYSNISGDVYSYLAWR